LPRLTDLLPSHTGPDPIITGLTADSRQVKPGFLFAALPGSRTDGRSFIPAALAAGAVAILVPDGTNIDGLPDAVALIQAPHPRRRLALLAAAFAGAQPETMVAVTGTNGKTSTAWFFRKIMGTLGHRAAAIGTLGVIADGWDNQGGLTTPDPVALHAILAKLAGMGVTHASLEASSHGLDQERLDGVALKAAAFTNLTRDHLDYHRDMEAYAAAKRRLFSELLHDDSYAVIDMDSDWSPYFAEAATQHGRRLITTGAAGNDIRLIEARPTPTGQDLRLTLFGRDVSVALPLAGRFQAHNALSALGLAIAIGEDADRALAALASLDGVPGRLQRVAERTNGAAIFVDYAHTPDALETVLRALKPHASGRLVALFGCGGNRDPGKRGLMGSIAGRLADAAIVTDDNPRDESPAAIRAAILGGCLGGVEIGDRHAAIRTAVAGLGPGDVLVIAGKGHETGQIVGDTVLPFDDCAEARAAVAAADGHVGSDDPLWSAAEAAEATSGSLSGRTWTALGVSIDSRSIRPGDLFVALVGPLHDGHDHVAAALEAGAAAAIVSRRPEGVVEDAPLLLVADTTAALTALARAARARSNARIAAITGSVGKTGTKEMLGLALAELGPTHTTAGNLNNHYGVPLSLARMPRDAAFAVFELGMNHPGELTPLSALVRPHVAIITSVEAVHLEFFASTEEIADAKAEILSGLEPNGIAVLPRDNRHFHRLAGAAAILGHKTRSFGNHIDSTARLLDCGIDPGSTAVFALIGERAMAYRVGVPGQHWALNSLAVLLAVEALGADPVGAARTLAAMTAPKGRGQRKRLPFGSGNIELIDESYNASPVSMAAAIATLASSRPAKGARRIAVLGDMLELGEDSPALHVGLAEAIETWGIDLVYTAGPLMSHLHRALDAARRGGHADSAEAVIPLVLEGLRPGDVVMVKGSAGSRMSRVVQALTERVPGQDAI